jgi:oligopeptide transport system substrate-binding protein
MFSLLRSLLLPGLLLSSAALAAADSGKVLHAYFGAPESGFDPAAYSDRYSLEVTSNIYETLLGYDYLARPQKLVPQLAEGLPQISDNGKTFVFRIKQGVYFTDDAAFGGKRRELTAQDVVYSLQRLVDPTAKAPWDFMLKGKVIGLDEKIAAGQKSGRFDYDLPIDGLRALDRYTLQIRLKKTDYNLPNILAAPATGVVAREVVEKYGSDFSAHPVGTGPYVLKDWQRATRIVLQTNPLYRGETYRPAAGATGVDGKVAQELAGKTFPRIGTIDIRIIESAQGAYLAFESGELDVLQGLGAEFTRIVAPGGKLGEAYVKRGVKYFREPEADLTYLQFNMENPVVGGYSPDKIALRRAMAMSMNQAKLISVVANNQALAAQSPVAPGITGYDPAFKNTLNSYSPARANALLDRFGYKDVDGDGWRELPSGKPLLITYTTSTGGDRRDFEEFLLKSLKGIGIKLEIRKMPFSELVKTRQSGQYQFAGAAWGADYPDAENFMQLLYGPNAGPGNESRFRNRQFDALYEDIATSPDSPERNAKLRQMSRIVAAYAPWIYNSHRIGTSLAQPWISGYKPHPDHMPHFKYLDIDLAAKAAAKKR